MKRKRKAVRLKYYPICTECVAGRGQECHTPGCSYCWSRVPPKMSFPEFGVRVRIVVEG